MKDICSFLMVPVLIAAFFVQALYIHLYVPRLLQKQYTIGYMERDRLETGLHIPKTIKHKAPIKGLKQKEHG